MAENKDLLLQVGDRTRVDFNLQVGNTQDTITVEANPVAVQTESGDVSSVVTAKQVSDLPTNGRTLYNLYSLTAGAVSLQGDNISPTAVSGDNNVSINGQRMGHNLMLIDGGENLDRGGSQASVAPSLESIGEFRDEYLELQRGVWNDRCIDDHAGGQVRHQGFSRQRLVVRARRRSRFAQLLRPRAEPVAELRYNLYGFNGGGPVDFWKKEHKTFFFYNMEWRSLIQGQLLTRPSRRRAHIPMLPAMRFCLPPITEDARHRGPDGRSELRCELLTGRSGDARTRKPVPEQYDSGLPH